jgi:23S rRNA (cytidine1920-2'-O)/16S rRNA (cytidine1409-2'-O)-methyltransferase
MRVRVDQLLVERGLASSRSQAQRLIASGVRWLDGAAWKTAAKNGDEVPDDAELELLDSAEARYVSRGGLKLEGALKHADIDVAGKNCLDVGQSTGGFTDCLLHLGAARVVGVDVGQGQLHDKLRSDERVVAIEKLNARELTAEDVGDDFDLIVGDLSFISMTLVLPALVGVLRGGGHLLMLAKPQFELQPGQVGKRGIVTDTSMYAVVEERIKSCCASLGLQVQGWFDSPVAGGDGNREFFVHAIKPEGAAA